MIDISKVEELKKKRELLKEKKRDEDRKNLIRDLTSFFDSKNIGYNLILDDLEDEFSSRGWVYRNYTFHLWARINQEGLNGCCVLNINNYQGCTEIVKDLISKNKFSADYVYIFWTDADRPLLKVKFKDFINYAYEIFEEDWDTWVFSPENNWCIEYHHDGELSFIPVME